MKKLLLILFIFAILSLVILLVLLIFGLQSQPLVLPGRKLDFEDVARVKQLMKENDPRQLKTGDIKRVSIMERDLNLFLDYAFSRSPKNQTLYAQVHLSHNLAFSTISYIFPPNPFGRYLNASGMIFIESNQIIVHKLKIGAINIPGSFVNVTSGLIHKLLLRFDTYKNMMQLLNSIKDIKIHDNYVSVTYQWQPELIKKFRAQGGRFILPENERERIQFYHRELATLSLTMRGQIVSVTHFFRYLFQKAENRTQAGGNAIQENRALILTLAAYSIGRDVDKLLGGSGVGANLPSGQVKLTLLGRRDLAKHFLVSAAISVSGGSGLAHLAGVFKEMGDSQSGSGFNFADLAADRAGVKFAELAISSETQAKLLQQKMSHTTNETDFMPATDDLPEGIQELEFKRQYKNLDSETYHLVENEIERRINACQIYR